ncbi:hypothetical protein [Sphingomonas sp. PP-CE-1G-424]|uniref:hypothetical protein n=1 Tax=Sphingomonas sp. PP-CE-1G-424 TaxID=2135658 RepID=UPI0010568388|nr:hypothetical protein [Sphingomonas sp. PP-CE-1G-424]
MTIKPIAVVFAAALALSIAAPAMAVGDLPGTLSQRQTAAIYKKIRPLLGAEGATCPAGQTVETGIVTGGSSPSGGSQTTTIMFNRGGKVVINRTWDSNVGKKLTISTKIDCS